MTIKTCLEATCLAGFLAVMPFVFEVAAALMGVE